VSGGAKPMTIQGRIGTGALAFRTPIFAPGPTAPTAGWLEARFQGGFADWPGSFICGDDAGTSLVGAFGGPIGYCAALGVFSGGPGGWLVGRKQPAAVTAASDQKLWQVGPDCRKGWFEETWAVVGWGTKKGKIKIWSFVTSPFGRGPAAGRRLGPRGFLNQVTRDVPARHGGRGTGRPSPSSGSPDWFLAGLSTRRGRCIVQAPISAPSWRSTGQATWKKTIMTNQ